MSEPERRTIDASDNPAVVRGMRSRNNGRYNGDGRKWATPPEVFDPLHAEFRFTLDPCAEPHTAKVPRYFTEADSGLEKSWEGERVFMNPPYGREIPPWTRKAREEAERGALVVGLLPASCDLPWWHEDIVAAGAEVRYLLGRPKFITDKPKYRASAFSPSVVVIWRPKCIPAPPGDTRPLAVDLFCGRGGWTKGLQAAGFRVVGVDSEPQPDYPGDHFIQADVSKLDGRMFRGAAVVTMSPPCPGFSLMNAQVLVGLRPSPQDIRLVVEGLRIVAEAQPRFWALENVRGALGWFRPLVGEPKLKNAPWYVWGNFPPFLVGKEKMLKFGGTLVRGKYSREDRKRWANAPKRQKAALSAEIPAELAEPLARACMDALLEEVVA